MTRVVPRTEALKHPRRFRWRRVLVAAVAAVLVYGSCAYLLVPAVWRHHEHHPAMKGAPKTTVNAAGIPADPLNVALVGTQPEIVRAFVAAGWAPADPITFRTSLGIIASVLLKRPDSHAPVSPLYLWGRREDLAFEREVSGSARQRHHVRVWRSGTLGIGRRPLWLGAATYDRDVGVSRRTGEVIHHIAPDIDAERDTLVADLSRAEQLTQVFQVTGLGPTLFGHNGDGDRYYTDGEMTITTVAEGNARQSSPPEQLPSPAVVAAKNRVWSWVRARF